MNRLQKKCLVAAAGSHFLLVVVLLCSGFITSKPKPDESQVLDVIPPKLVDAALQSGVRSAPPPPPTPEVKPPEPIPLPPPEPPKPEVKPVEPPKPVEPVKVQEPIEPEVARPDVHTEPKPPRKIEVILKPVVRNSTTEPDHKAEEAKKAREAEQKAEAQAEREAAREAKRARDARNKMLTSAASSIRENVSSATTVELHGDNTVAYANYGSIVKSVYTLKWILPDTAANDEANVKVSVTIARDGQVIESHIIERSGDSSLDASVQRTLNRVRNIAPFPDDATDKERTYIINFNLKAKRGLG